MKILQELRIPELDGNDYFVTILEGEKINLIELKRGDETFHVPLLGYTPDFLFQVLNQVSVKFSSMNELLPGFSQPITNILPPRAPSAPIKQDHGPKSTSPRQFSKTITVDEAVAIMQRKAQIHQQMVKVDLNSANIVAFIAGYRGGSTIYEKRVLTDMKAYKLFIDFDLFKETLEQLLHQNIISLKNKISGIGNPYSVYVIPKDLLEKTVKPKEEKVTLVPANALPPISQNPEVQPRPFSQPAIQKNIMKDNELEALFNSYADSELDLELFVSEAQFKKISREESMNFFRKKIAERERKLLQKVTAAEGRT